MLAVNNESQPDDSPSGSPLLEQLYKLYTAERQLAMDLSALFHRTTSIPMRLDLSDRRKETARHLLRLERLIQVESGNPASHVVAGMTTLRPSVSDADEGDVGFEIPLRALQLGITAYGEAISTATRLGHASIADVLGETVTDKSAAIIAFSACPPDRPPV